LPPDKGGKERVGERRGENGRGGERNEEKGGEEEFRAPHSSKFATTPLVNTDMYVYGH